MTTLKSELDTPIHTHPLPLTNSHVVLIVVVDDDRTAASEISADSTRGQSLESIPSAYTNGSNSPLHNSKSSVVFPLALSL